MSKARHFNAEYRNIVGAKLPSSMAKAWVTMVRCKKCGHKMLSNGKIMWCEACAERIIEGVIASAKTEHEKRLIYAFYYGSTPNMMALIGMTIFKLIYYIKQMRKEKDYDVPTRETVKQRIAVKIN